MMTRKAIINTVRLNSPKEILSSASLVTAYTCLSLLYFNYFGQKFYIKNLFNCGITIAIPLPYIVLTSIFLLLYASVLREDPKRIALPVIAMALILPIFLLIANLKIGMTTLNPFSFNRGIYKIYAGIYCAIALASFSIFTGIFFRGILKNKICSFLGPNGSVHQRMIFHLPVLIYFIFIEAVLILNGLAIHASFFLLLSLVFLLPDTMVFLSDRVKPGLEKLFKNELFFLTAIFLLAFALRYLWGERIIGPLGARFLIASDDGRAYDKLASMIARGEIIPKSDFFCLSGFGYWYFLAGLYKIFGAHNFKAVVIVQSFLGALVPVFTYLISKNIFKRIFPSIIAAIITSFNLTLVFLSSVIGMEALYIPLFFLALTAASYFMSSDRYNYWKAFAVGGLFGFANNARGELLFMPFLLSILAFFLIKSRNMNKIRPALLAAGAVFLGFVLFMSMQHIASYVIYSEYHIAPSSVKGVFVSERFGEENAALANMGFNPFKSMGASVSALLNNPFKACDLIFTGFSKRIIIYYLQPNFGVFDPIFLVNPASGYLFDFPLYLQFLGYMFIIVGIVTALMKKENIIPKIMLLMIVVFISSIYAFIIVQNSRNRGVLIPIAVILFSYGLSRFLHHLKIAYSPTKDY